MPPSFHSKSYWETRFQKETQPFEWLLPYSHIEDFLTRHIFEGSRGSGESGRSEYSEYSEGDGRSRKILHIGCGTSDLSSQLLGLYGVEGASNRTDGPEVEVTNRTTKPTEGLEVWNVDYSPAAISLGKARESASLQEPNEKGHTENNDRTPRHNTSKWEVLDLLNSTQVLEFNKNGPWDIIVDKSTADAISCGDDVQICLPLPQSLGSSAEVDGKKTRALHPLYVLALHLAILTSPGARWLVCSYSATRFPFWDGEVEEEGESAEWLRQRRCHPESLWRLEEFEEVVKATRDAGDGVHRPPEKCFLYTLVRCDGKVL